MCATIGYPKSERALAESVARRDRRGARVRDHGRVPPTELQRLTAAFVVSVRRAAIGPRARRHVKRLTGLEGSGLELLVLMSINGHDLVPLGQVAGDLRVGAPMLSRACRQLEGRGELIRLADPRDRRRTLIGLSEHAAAALARWNHEWPLRYAEPVLGWNEADCDALARWFAAVNLDLWDRSVEPHDRYAWRPLDRAEFATPGMIRFANVVRDLVTQVGRFDEVHRIVRGLGVDLPEPAFFALMDLAEQPAGVSGGEGVRVSELARAQAVDPALARRTLAPLAADGLVEQRQGRDAVARVTLSPRGADLVQLVLAELASGLPQEPLIAPPAGLATLLARYLDVVLRDDPHDADGTIPPLLLDGRQRTALP